MEFELPKDFKELFVLLNANNVRYLLIGGYAVGIYGYSRTTNNIDIFIADDPENVRNLVKTLIEFRFGVSGISEEMFSEPRSMVEMGIEPMKIQLMNFADGLSFQDAYAQRHEVRIEDIVVQTISKSDLIRNKKVSGRYKDLADVERLERMN